MKRRNSPANCFFAKRAFTIGAMLAATCFSLRGALAQDASTLRSQGASSPDSSFVRGADLSLLGATQEARVIYKDGGRPKEPLQIFKDHGCNFVRLRLFVRPDGTQGQVNTLAYTLRLARRVKAANLSLLLDFHFSDGWADPAHQTIPAQWKTLSHAQLVERVRSYTRQTIAAFAQENCSPAMVQIGNEITNGMMWPDGGPLNSQTRWDALAYLFNAGVQGVRESDPQHAIRIMLHLDAGGNKNTCLWFLDNFARRNVAFDVIGLSYYPFWHGPFADLKENLASLSKTYKKDIYVVDTGYDWNGGEQNRLPYPLSPEGQKDFLEELRRVVAATPDGHGKGVFYWAPEWIQSQKWAGPGWSNTWEDRALFDSQGNALPAMQMFEPQN